MNTIQLSGQKRAETGKKATKAIRKSGAVPCVLYGGDELIHFSVMPLDVRGAIYTPDLHIVEVTVDGATHKCIVKDVVFHPVTDNMMHIDFLRLIPNHAIKLQVPVRLTGASSGVKAGGKLMQKVRRVKVKTTPEQMVTELSVDVSNLGLGQSIRVRDIELTEGVEIMSPGGTPLGSVEIPRALRSAKAAAEK